MIPPRVFLIGRPSLVSDGLAAFQDFAGIVSAWSVDSVDPGTQLAELAGRADYWSFDPARRRPGGAAAYFQRILSAQHMNILEIPHWQFVVICSQGVAREVLRYRMAERSQTSTRYVDYTYAPLVRLLSDPPLSPIECEADRTWRVAYQVVYGWEYAAARVEGHPMREARKRARSLASRLIPFAAATVLILAMNAVTWRHVMLQRLTPEAHPEFRELARQWWLLAQQEMPLLVQDLAIVGDRLTREIIPQRKGV